MKRRIFLKNSSIAGLGLLLATPLFAKVFSTTAIKRKILISGGDFDAPWMRYLINLTGKLKPKICLLPTASGDDKGAIDYWIGEFKKLTVDLYVQKVFIDSDSQKISFENFLLGMDAILVPGGNTLNMIALWKAQGIDSALKKAWEKGIILSGSSAGAVCWFQQAIVDSRPIRLTKLKGLGFLKGSCCAHYHATTERTSAYLNMISTGTMLQGYGLENNAGLYFENEAIARVLAVDKMSKVFKVELKSNKVAEIQLQSTLLP